MLALSSTAATTNNVVALSDRLEAKLWNFQGHDISYERTKSYSSDISEDEKIHEPILLLNGFGVGSFHQHRLKSCLLKEMSVLNEGGVRNIYGIDYLGQGKSWPTDCNDGLADSERDLTYSIDTWMDQVISFIDEVVVPENLDPVTGQCKVHLVGNSVGGHLATIIAYKRPDLIKSISLLNATPVWGLGLPGWNGALPPPSIPRKVGRFLFDKIRDIDTINLYLAQAYSRREAFDDELVSQIRGCTEGNGGHAAFASIVWSSPSSVLKQEGTFSDLISKVKCDVLLLFGDDDTWCKPAYAKHMMKILSQRESASSLNQRYFALTNTGHCPNHEAPQAVAHAISRWVASEKRDTQNLQIVNGPATWREKWGSVEMREVEENEFDNLTLSDKLMIRMLA